MSQALTGRMTAEELEARKKRIREALNTLDIEISELAHDGGPGWMVSELREKLCAYLDPDYTPYAAH